MGEVVIMIWIGLALNTSRVRKSWYSSAMLLVVDWHCLSGRVPNRRRQIEMSDNLTE